MKKALLLFSVSLMVLSAGAQQLTNSGPTGPASGHKTTSIGGADWFVYNIARDNFPGSHSALIDVYPDSNIHYPSATPSPYYIWSHGLGVVFDPVSPFFSTAWVPTLLPPPSIIVTAGSSYTLDSVGLAGRYQRVNTGYPNDTLFIDVTYTSDTGAWLLTYAGSYLVTFGIIPTPVHPWDTIWHTANAYYNAATNSIDGANTTPVWRFVKILDSAAAVDTDALTGLSIWKFPTAASPAIGSAPWPMAVPAGMKVVMYAHFASGHNYPLGTPNTAANLWKHYSQDFPGGSWAISPQDMSAGLVATTKDRYSLPGHTYYTFPGGPEPILSWTFPYSPPEVESPWFGYFVTCSGCSLTEVANSNLVSDVKAVPNPAGDILTVTYTMNQNASGTIVLTDVLGQVVATQKATNGKVEVNTSALPGGIYIYSLEINGQRNSGRVVIGH